MAMPVRYAVASMLAAAGGALLAFAAVGAALGGVAIVAHPIGATARTRVMLGVAGIILEFSVSGGRQFMPTTALGTSFTGAILTKALEQLAKVNGGA